MILTDNIPQEMKEKKQWIFWENQNGRKMPLMVESSNYAKSNDPDTWSTFQIALKYYGKNTRFGLGYVFNGDYIGIDLDHCIDENGLNQFAKDVIARCASYTEYSPSKKGIHIIGKGNISRALKTDKIEIYNTGRYFTMTGHVLYGRKHINEIDVSSYYTQNGISKSVSSQLNEMKPGNVDNTLTSLAGKLYRKGMFYSDVFALLKEKANKEGHDDDALHRICKSVGRYHEGEQNGQRNMGRKICESKSIQIFSPKTHTEAFLTSLKQTGDGTVELSTGFPTLDKCTGGLKRKSLWVVGARTSIGKTAFSSTVANHLLENNKRVLIFSTESTWETVFSRFAALGTGISLHKLTDHKEELTGEDTQRLKEFSEEFKSKSLYIVEESKPNLRTVSEEVSRVRPDVFIFDYIQHIEEASEIRHADIRRFIMGLEELAKETNSAGLIASQLNRSADVEIPRLSHLSDSSTIENTANSVILLSKLGEDITIADLAKNRGPKGRVELKFDPITARFEEI